jgi:hypothetical protein
VARFERDANFAVRLETANARAVACARIDYDERTPRRIEFNCLGRNNPD